MDLIRVNELIQNSRLQDLPAAKDNIKNGDFEFTLGKFDSSKMHERLSRLISEITDTGLKMSKRRDLSDMKHYRGLIGQFINEVVGNAHKFKRDNFLDRRGRHRVFGIIQLVNKNLDELASELLKEERDNLRILGKIDEIRGLLLDILM